MTSERLVYARLSEFLRMNNKLSSSQHGYRRGHSCQTQLLATTHEWAKSLNKGVSTHVIYLDLSKAFDSVPHQRLLMKLDCMGISGNLLSWIAAFLHDREQRVFVEGIWKSRKQKRNGKWKWKLETETGNRNVNKTHQSLVLHSVLCD